MFHSARIKLTAWYLLIIMVICLSFSVAMYRALTFELDRVERMQRSRIERFTPERFYFIDPQLIKETKNRLKVTLGLIDLAILSASAAAAYFLAGRTLKPISKMVDEQNRFITDASHELRTPLTSLKSEIEVFLRGKDISPAETKKLLKSNLEEINNLQVLSDGLIRLTSYQKGGNGPIFENVSLKSITKEAVKKVIKLAKNKKIEIVDKTTDFIFEAERSAMVELLVIFLDNAIKYSPENTKISLSGEKKDGYIIICVADQGIGIDKEEIPHIFDRFYQSDKSRTKLTAPGYGLGLSIAKQIVEKHQGSISVQSKLRKGTTFFINIPIKHSEKAFAF